MYKCVINKLNLTVYRLVFYFTLATLAITTFSAIETFSSVQAWPMGYAGQLWK